MLSMEQTDIFLCSGWKDYTQSGTKFNKPQNSNMTKKLLIKNCIFFTNTFWRQQIAQLMYYRKKKKKCGTFFYHFFCDTIFFVIDFKIKKKFFLQEKKS